jgi:segregation and condensation protein B
MNNTELKSRIESLLFVSGKPISFRKLASILNIEAWQIRDLLAEINNDYEESRRGLRVVLRSDSAQLVSAPQNAGFVQKLITDELQEDLSRAALETLAIIAYRGPITRAEIEMIRGVNCIYILRNLSIRGLVDKRESKKDARAFVYEASFDFLKHLGVRSVKELPDYEKLKESISLERKPSSENGR